MYNLQFVYHYWSWCDWMYLQIDNLYNIHCFIQNCFLAARFIRCIGVSKINDKIETNSNIYHLIQCNYNFYHKQNVSLQKINNIRLWHFYDYDVLLWCMPCIIMIIHLLKTNNVSEFGCIGIIEFRNAVKILLKILGKKNNWHFNLITNNLLHNDLVVVIFCIVITDECVTTL